MVSLKGSSGIACPINLAAPSTGHYIGNVMLSVVAASNNRSIYVMVYVTILCVCE